MQNKSLRICKSGGWSAGTKLPNGRHPTAMYQSAWPDLWDSSLGIVSLCDENVLLLCAVFRPFFRCFAIPEAIFGDA